MNTAMPPHVCAPLLTNAQAHTAKARTRVHPHHARAIDIRSLATRTAALSHSLSSRPLHIQPGHVVMLAATDSGTLLEALLAVCDAGAIASPINFRWGAAELAAAMQLTQPTAILADAACWGLVHKALGMQSQAVQDALHDRVVLLGSQTQQAGGPASTQPGGSIVTGSSNTHTCPASAAAQMLTVEALIAAAAARKLASGAEENKSSRMPVQRATDAESSADEEHDAGLLQLQLKAPSNGAAIICFTSGTTGHPKGVVLTHAAIHTQSLAKLATIGYDASDTYLHMAPLFHVGGLSSAHAALMAGCQQVLLPRFEAGLALETIHREGVTTFIAVPAMLQDLVTRARSEAVTTLPSVRKILLGAGATSPQLLGAAAQLFPHARIMSAYGMTETASSITFITLRQPLCSHKPHSVHRTTTTTTTITNSATKSMNDSEDSTPKSSPCSTQQHTSGQPLHEQAAPHANAASRGNEGMPAMDAHAAGGDSGSVDVSSRGGAVCVGRPGPGVRVQILSLKEGEQPQYGQQMSDGVGGGKRQLSVGSHERGRDGVNGGQLDCGAGSQRVEGLQGGSQYRFLGRGGGLGEVCVQGACVMSGYWRAPRETEQVFLPGRWLRTGDLGFLDAQGALWLQGRAKDMIKTGGENVHAAEVEAALCRHPGVATAAVFGVPDARMGESVAAAVVLRPGWVWKGLELHPQLLHQHHQQHQHQQHQQQQQQQQQQQVPHHDQQRLPQHSTACPNPQHPTGNVQNMLSADLLRAFCRSGTVTSAGPCDDPQGHRHHHQQQHHHHHHHQQQQQHGLLSPYKLPRIIVATQPTGAPLPCNASGKVLKPQLRAAVPAMLAANGMLSTGRLGAQPRSRL